MTAAKQEPSLSRRRRRPAEANVVNELVIGWQRDGDRAAREELVVRFIPLARSLANRYRNSAEPAEDLEQVASLGLLSAIDRFDPSRGSAFSSYAVPTILGELKRHFRNTGWSAHVPRRQQEIAIRINNAIAHLSAAQGHSPSLAAVAGYLGISLEEALEGVEASAARFSTSLDAPTHDGEDAVSVGDLLGQDDDRLGLVEMSASLSLAIACLPHRERRALALRFQRGMKQSEIGEVLGCSQMQVSRLLQRASAHVRALTAQDDRVVRS